MKYINLIAEKLGKWIAWVNIALILLICFDVLSRALFKTTQSWVMEMEWHLFAVLFILGSMVTYKNDGHVRVDVFYSHYSQKQKAWVDLIGTIVLLVPWILVILITSWKFAMTSFNMMEGSPNPGGLPFLFVIKFVLVLGFALLGLQAVSKVNDAITIIRSR